MTNLRDTTGGKSELSIDDLLESAFRSIVEKEDAKHGPNGPADQERRDIRDRAVRTIQELRERAEGQLKFAQGRASGVRDTFVYRSSQEVNIRRDNFKQLFLMNAGVEESIAEECTRRMFESISSSESKASDALSVMSVADLRDAAIVSIVAAREKEERQPLDDTRKQQIRRAAEANFDNLVKRGLALVDAARQGVAGARAFFESEWNKSIYIPRDNVRDTLVRNGVETAIAEQYASALFKDLEGQSL